MVKVLESTLEWTQGEVIVNSGIGSHTPCLFFLDSAAVHMLNFVECIGSTYLWVG